MNTGNGKKVIAAMSGGVDSSCAAALLQRQGYDVVGVTLNVWPSEESAVKCARTCCSITDVDDARQVCYKLGIPHYVLNMRDYFREHVIDYFIGEYLKGRTPNPCIACNAYVKFEALLRKAEALGADYIATGHYAEIVRAPQGGLCLRRSVDTHKDQTYVLYMLGQRQLSRLLLPCGGYTKPQIRALAEQFGLPTFKKPDSQDLCFVGPEGYAGFIRANCGGAAKPGKVVDRQGRVLGEHDGIYNFTIGQRKGLGRYTNVRSFVTAIDAATGTVTLGSSEDLYAPAMEVDTLSQAYEGALEDGAHLMVKIRYNAPACGARLCLRPGENGCKVFFDTPQRAVTAGQAAVFYEDERVLGGGVIAKALPSA
jgi:tRNA-specific 2-thiouridylase